MYNPASKVVEEETPTDYQLALKKRMFFDNTLEKQTVHSKRHKTLNFSEQGKFIQ